MKESLFNDASPTNLHVVTSPISIYSCPWIQTSLTCAPARPVARKMPVGALPQTWMHWTVTPSHIGGPGVLYPENFWNFVRKIMQFCSFLQFQDLYIIHVHTAQAYTKLYR